MLDGTRSSVLWQHTRMHHHHAHWKCVDDVVRNHVAKGGNHADIIVTLGQDFLKLVPCRLCHVAFLHWAEVVFKLDIDLLISYVLPEVTKRCLFIPWLRGAYYTQILHQLAISCLSLLIQCPQGDM